MIKNISVSPDPTLTENFGYVGGHFFFYSVVFNKSHHFTVFFHKNSVIAFKKSFNTCTCLQIYLIITPLNYKIPRTGAGNP